MIRKPLSAIVFTALIATGTQAFAQVYRCGDTYSQQPCAGGKVIAPEDARSASQRTSADELTRREVQAADAMEKARLAREDKPAQVAMPPSPVSSRTDEPSAKPAPRKAVKPERFIVPTPEKAALKAAKKEEKAEKLAEKAEKLAQKKAEKKLAKKAAKKTAKKLA